MTQQPASSVPPVQPSVQVPDAEVLLRGALDAVPDLKMIEPQVRLITMLVTNRQLGLDADLAINMIESSVDKASRTMIVDAINKALVVVNHAAAELAKSISSRTTRAISPETFANLDRITQAELSEQDATQGPAIALQTRLAARLKFFNDGGNTVRVRDLWAAEKSRPTVQDDGVVRWRKMIASAIDKVPFLWIEEPTADVMVEELNWATAPVLDMSSKEMTLLLKQLTFMEQLEAKLKTPDAVLKQLANMTWSVERIENLFYGANAIAARQIGQSTTIVGVAQRDQLVFAQQIGKIMSVRSLLAEAKEYIGA